MTKLSLIEEQINELKEMKVLEKNNIHKIAFALTIIELEKLQKEINKLPIGDDGYNLAIKEIAGSKK